MSQPEFVSIVTLIANPTSCEGKRVRVIGLLVADFEGTGLLLGESDAKNSVSKNGIWLEIEPADYASLGGSFALVEGTFDSKSHGHLSMWSGTIRDVTRLEAWRR